MMSSLYKVTEIKGKGLGCVAIVDIEKGSLILNENPKMCADIEEVDMSLGWIKSLLKSFNKMNKADQLEFMALHTKCSNFQDRAAKDLLLGKFSSFQDYQNSEDFQNYKKIIDKDLECLEFEIGKFERDPQKAKEILKICCIYFSNRFVEGDDGLGNGVRIKTSRFNHSCQPNAVTIRMVNGLPQVRAIRNIKSGQEINLNYIRDTFCGFRNRKYRQNSLFKGWFFHCSCDLCENDVDDAYAHQTFIQDAEKLTIDRELALKAEYPRGPLYYSLENCRKEVICYKKLYNVGKSQNIQPYSLYLILHRGFLAAAFGYQMYKADDLKIDAMNFAKKRWLWQCNHFSKYSISRYSCVASWCWGNVGKIKNVLITLPI